MAKNLTLHFLTNVPYSNLNRDDAGTPKRVIVGGQLRALHSSQSIKRGIRARYEEASLDTSVRSGQLTDEIVRLAYAIRPESDLEALKERANELVSKLTSNKGKSANGSDRSVWMSREEINVATQRVLDEKGGEFIQDDTTGSLAIAAFGRMFAKKPNKNTEAAIAVSPGVTTHATPIESDYFTTVDDLKVRDHKTGATYLGVQRYVNGTFYRPVTIDKEQLKRSWSAFDDPESRDNVRELLRAMVYGAPRGKENSTAPYTMPVLILAEEQRCRTSYEFETPVEPNEGGGFEAPSITALSDQYQRAREFDAGNFGDLQLLSGTAKCPESEFPGADRVNLHDLIERVVDWIYA